MEAGRDRPGGQLVPGHRAGHGGDAAGGERAQRDTLALDVLSEGDPGLLNVYHVIEMTTRAGERVQPEGAQAFADWVVSPPAQQRIAQFGQATFGQPLFTPDAGKDESALGR